MIIPVFRTKLITFHGNLVIRKVPEDTILTYMNGPFGSAVLGIAMVLHVAVALILDKIRPLLA